VIHGGTVELAGRRYAEKDFELVDVKVSAGARVIASVNGTPFIVRSTHGRGIVDVIASPYGLNAQPLTRQAVKQQAGRGHPGILRFPRFGEGVFRRLPDEQKLVDVGNPHLQYSTNVLDARTLVVTLAKQQSSWQPFALTSPAGNIASVNEWKLPPCPPARRLLPRRSKQALLAEVAKGGTAGTAGGAR